MEERYGFRSASGALREVSVVDGVQTAPASTQALSVAISALLNGCPLIGIRGSNFPVTRRISILPALSPATMAGPLEPPFSSSARVFTDKPPWPRSPLWQLEHLATKMGCTSLAKSTGSPVPIPAATRINSGDLKFMRRLHPEFTKWEKRDVE